MSDKLPLHTKKGHQLLFSYQDLSARESDLFTILMSFMKDDDWLNETPEYQFSSHNLSKWLGIDNKHLASSLNPLCERLSEKKMGFKDSNTGDFDYIPLFKRFRYKNRELTIVPNDILKEQYIAYRNGFALISTDNQLSLKREYTKRLYEILCRFKGKDGRYLKPLGIKELQGMFGILNEKDELKRDKKSFKNNSVFMKRCIKESIEELCSNPNTKKEIMFLPGERGSLGYSTHTIGNKIMKIEFLYRWISKSSNTELTELSPDKIILMLENKRTMEKIKLSVEELESLAAAYASIGQTDRSDKIISDIQKRKELELDDPTDNSDLEDEEADKMKALLDKIAIMEESSGIDGY
ncbi:MAG: plasmid replication initiation protein [Colwellia sp.]|jgi:plasmid replication initiation protein